ncbi:hypothetical protein GGS23DRAFT_606654 [Durotheca rogersii]|uniref:uncharacterized protein n=1 Tax=Durotheca rogersii TaxID=419775 RepID=UPI00221F5024|nr:uncharacterized protein GGS23DRAFT_606654 [Durotheca rogersii]KAI5860890.1 hypothetical protein GGS23DRAFT_606654 [Durotheca rogersii]
MDALSAARQETPSMKCCCGSVGCVFLRHNYSVLASVEKDVHTAARMGQALLARHEAYMADAERDRRELTARIEQLEMDNKELEARNAKTIEDNRNLLDHLEALNSSIVDSEYRIKSLEATLLSSQQTIRRLEGDTARAAALERQILALEQEQAELQSHLSLSREEARSAASRWKRAERGINDLQEQLERMEREAKEEREHHVEMISRIERQREMEKELNTAAGRLKGAAAAKSLDHGNGNVGGSSVVSHFVRDLLQDNANLQCGIAELREMLMNSNDEIQALRDQLAYHQPLEDDRANTMSTLRAELEPLASPVTSPKPAPEVHIHHHYHLEKSKQEAKKPRKKRAGLAPGIFTPPSSSAPSTPPNGPARSLHTHKDSLLSNYWSDFAPSSVPSSPLSNNRNSLFDHVTDSTPASPTTSIDPMSPSWHATHHKQLSSSSRNFQFPNLAIVHTPTRAHPVIEESYDEDTPPDLTTATDDSTVDDVTTSSEHQDMGDDELSVTIDDTGDHRTPSIRLRRPPSHESIISLSGGLDIHTLTSRPSQLTLRHLGSAASVTGSSIVTARPMLSHRNANRSSARLREDSDTSPVGSLQSVLGISLRDSRSSRLGKWVGWRPWGGGGLGGTSGGGISDASSDTSTKTNRGKGGQKAASRPPGINQPGAIPGFLPHAVAAQRKTLPTHTQPDVVDRDALMEGLVENIQS